MADPVLDRTAATPGRATRVTFDLTEQVVLEDSWGGVRFGAEVAPAAAKQKGADGKFASGMRYWDSGDGWGAWTLKPLQMDPSDLQEKELVATTVANVVYGPGGLTDLQMILSADILQYVIWKEPTGNGMVHVPGIVSSGDVMQRKKNTAGATWASGLLIAPAGPLTNTTKPMDTLGVTPQMAQADQPFFLRWWVPGTPNHYPDNILTFWFGQYALNVKGNGQAEVWEYARDKNSVYHWSKRDTFRYSQPGQTCGRTHTMMIFPLLGPAGQKAIFFHGNYMETAQALVFSLGPRGRHPSSIEYVYKADDAIRGGDRDEAPGHVTKAAPIRLDVRRDLRIFWQISKLIFAGQGILYDQTWNLPPTATTTGLTTQLYGRQPSSSTITADVLEATTEAAFNAATGHKRPYVKFTFSAPPSGGGYNPFITPILFGYKLKRDVVIGTIAPGAFTTDVTQVSVNGGDGRDPRQEAASVSIQDPANAYPRLANRGILSAMITTTYTPPGEAPTTVTLFRGACVRPGTTRRGKFDENSARVGVWEGQRQGGAATGTRRVYPSPNWREYHLAFVGMWEKLSRRNTRNVLSFREYFADPAAPDDPITGSKSPWKVTDVIRNILFQAGFTTAQIDIPDSPLRLWTGAVNGNADGYILPDTNLADRVQALARDYLGAYLIWESNASTDGQWTLLFAPDPDADPVYAFLTYRGTANAIPHLPGAYPANTSFLESIEGAYNVQPEGNHVWVLTAPESAALGSSHAFHAHAYNPKSYAVPGMDAPDPDHPDYIGSEVVIIRADASLYASEKEGGHAATQRAVNWTCRRIFEYSCHSRRIQPARAPLVFVKDALTLKWRPLRFHDPVLLNGERWYVRSVSPDYNSDAFQMAHYELEQTEAH